MPTHYEAALMSHLAYQYHDAKMRLNNKYYLRDQSVLFTRGFDCNQNDLRVLFCNAYGKPRLDHLVAQYLHNKGWQVFYTSNHSTRAYYDPHSTITDYFGVAFINTRDSVREIVVAHRGTIVSSSQNIQDDIKILKTEEGEEPDILSDALLFIARIIRLRDSTPAINTYTLTQTGHSLGGFLAEFGAAYVASPESLPDAVLADCAYTKLHVPRPHSAFAITFDSLGSQRLLSRFGIPSNGARTINYLLQPNMANTGNRHDGERRQLFKTEPELEGAISYYSTFSVSPTRVINIQDIFTTIQSHLLTNFLNGYFNPHTGEPILYRQVYDWPVATNIFTYSRTPAVAVPSFREDESWGEGFKKIFVFGVGLFSHVHTAGVIQLQHQHRGQIRYTAQDHTDTSTSSSSSSSFTPTPGAGVLESMAEADSMPATTDLSETSSTSTQQPVPQQSMFASTASSSSQPMEETAVRSTRYRPRGNTF